MTSRLQKGGGGVGGHVFRFGGPDYEYAMLIVRAHPWMNPIVFGNNRPNKTTDTGENVAPKTSFSDLSRTV